MLKATAGIIMPTTITGSLPRPSWYTENLGTKSFLDAMVISRGSASSTSTRCRCICASRKSPGSTSSPTATAGSTRTSAGRAGRAIRRITWRVRRDAPEAGDGRRRRHRVSARPHPARLPRSAGDAEDRRAGRPRRDAVCGDLEGGAAADAEAGEVRDGHAGAGRVRRAGRALQGHARRGSWRSATRSTRSCTTWRMPAAR